MVTNGHLPYARKDLGFVQYRIIPFEHYYNDRYYDDYSFELLIENEMTK